MPQKVGEFVGKEGPAIAGMAGAAALSGGASLPAAAGAAALGGGAGEAYRQIFGRAIGGRELSSGEAGQLVAAQMIKQAATEVGGRATTKTFQIIRGMLPESLNALAGMPAEYIRRAIQNQNTALPRAGESLASVEGQAIKHLQAVQEGVEAGRREAGIAVDKALETLHVKTGGKKIVDTQPLADAMRRVVADKFRSEDPTVQAVAKSDMEKIAKVLRTMETTTTTRDTGILTKEGKPFTVSVVNKPMKSVRDLVQIRRELDNLVGYTPAGVPKMESDLGQRFAKSLADEFRGLISKTAESQGDKSLLMANSRFSNVAKNYDEWQPVLTTKTEGEPAAYARVKALDRYISQGGAASESLKTLKEAFPQAARSVDNLHDALARRAFIVSPGAGEKEIIKPLIRSIMGPGGTGAAAVRGVNAGVAGGGNVARAAGSAMPSSVIQALLAHIKP
jgi:hypothetical protein